MDIFGKIYYSEPLEVVYWKKRWKKSKFLRRPTWQTVLKALGILSITDPVALDLLKTLATALNAAAGRSGIDQEDLK